MDEGDKATERAPDKIETDAIKRAGSGGEGRNLTLTKQRDNGFGEGVRLDKGRKEMGRRSKEMWLIWGREKRRISWQD